MHIKIVDKWLDAYNIDGDYENINSKSWYDEVNFEAIERDIKEYCEENEIDGELKITNDYSRRLYRPEIENYYEYYEFLRDYKVGEEEFQVVRYEERN